MKISARYKSSELQEVEIVSFFFAFSFEFYFFIYIGDNVDFKYGVRERACIALILIVFQIL